MPGARMLLAPVMSDAISRQGTLMAVTFPAACRVCPSSTTSTLARQPQDGSWAWYQLIAEPHQMKSTMWAGEMRCTITARVRCAPHITSVTWR